MSPNVLERRAAVVDITKSHTSGEENLAKTVVID